MEIRNIELRELKPSAGMALTNGIVYSDDVIYIGCNNSPEEYYDITLEEYTAYLALKSEEAELEEE